MTAAYADHIEALGKVFTSRPKRMDWLTLAPEKSPNKSMSVLILRNTTFENIASMASALLKFGGHNADWTYSSYDTSFPQLEELLLLKKWDLVVLWVDWGFLEAQNERQQDDFIKSLLKRTTQIFSGPVVLTSWKAGSPIDKIIQGELSNNSNFICTNISELESANHIEAFDARYTQMTTSCFSKEFDMAFARRLACSIVPCLVGIKLRGLILDLDQTLYTGVLGEDGLNGIKFTDSHTQIWTRLSQLKEQGVLLAIASKNNLADVKELLEKSNLPLKFDDFAVVAANWNSKSENIKMIVDAFNFSEEFILFIDDNPNELLSVKTLLPKLNIFKADETGGGTLLALNEYPGLRQLKIDSAAKSRTLDIQANFKRNELAQKFKNSKLDYLKELEINIEISRDDDSVISRIADLSSKTNQFNLTFNRSNESTVRELVSSGQGHVYSVSLTDRFADSGVVGGALLSKDKETAFFAEFLFSCRALGREAETFFLKQILVDLGNEGMKSVKFKVVVGAKNQPALDWLSKLEIKENTHISILELLNRCESIIKDYPAKLSWKGR